ncbi:hypothetical protein BDF21DRAFT_433616 [Thamnidium elegans]|nr:hypothetical protein BDF21DRAFT_433616 [Thamnidium elegans]
MAHIFFKRSRLRCFCCWLIIIYLCTSYATRYHHFRYNRETKKTLCNSFKNEMHINNRNKKIKSIHHVLLLFLDIIPT